MPEARDPAAQRRVLEVFEACLDCEPPARAGVLDETCGDDAELRAEVERLLALADKSDPLRPVTGSVVALAEAATTPSRVGPYAILERIGAGGMGEVFLAERDDGAFRRRVAVKRLRAGLNTEELLARFQRERQVQATLDHPGIARLLDGGQDDGGAPYLVLEHVAGAPVDAWCDEVRLSVRDRLALFARVCDAVEYAHQRGVVHRDLKPSNIMVTPEGEPKLLDFGIAKVLDEESFADEFVITQETFRMMTPAYASPEQLRFEPATEAADQYALGVILYRLLTGRLPHDFDGQSPAAIERIVTEEDPSPPSAVIGSDEETHATRRELRGDLDRIVLMALRKEPRRRYASVAGLAEDVRRHLGGRPVLARPDEKLYRLNRFVSRNRLAVALASGIIAALTIGLVVALNEARAARAAEAEAALERDDAEAVTDFLTETLLSAKPGGAVHREATVRDVLDAAALRIERGQFTGRPIVESRVLQTLGDSYAHLSVYETAIRHLRRSLEIRLAELGPLDKRTIEAEFLLIISLKFGGGAVEGEARARALIERMAAGGAHLEQIHRVRNVLGGTLRVQKRFEEAEAVFRQAYEGLRATQGPDGLDTIGAMNNLGVALNLQGRHEEAESLLQECLERTVAALGPRHPEVLNRRLNLGQALSGAGQQPAISYFESLVDDCCATLGVAHIDTCIARSNFAGLLSKRGDLDRALELMEYDYAVSFAQFGPDHDHTLAALAEVARVRFRVGQTREAFLAAIPQARRGAKVFGANSKFALNARFGLGVILLRLKRASEARDILVPLLEEIERVYGVGHKKTRSVLWALKDASLALGDRAFLPFVLERELEIERAISGIDHARTLRVAFELGVLQHRAGRTEVAVRHLLDVFERRDAIGRPAKELVESASALATAYRALGDEEEAARWDARVSEPAARADDDAAGDA